MKKSIIIDRRKWTILLIMWSCCFCILHCIFNFFDGTLLKPLTYTGGDDLAAYSTAKSIIDSGWAWIIDDLGAPFGTQNLDHPPYVLNILNLLIMKVFSLFTKNPFLVMNLLYVLAFFMICTISYLVMTYLKINYAISAIVSLVYAFMPYIFLRAVMHYVLSTYQFIPLSFLLCVWIYRNEVFKDKKRLLSVLLICILIGINGIAYYPFFTCIFLMVTGLSITLTHKNIKPMLQAAVCCLSISLTLILALVPSFIYSIQNGPNKFTGVRGPLEAEYYGLKIVQLLLPINPSKGKLAALQKIYSEAPLPNEGSEYLGIIGIIGFIALIIGLFTYNEKKENDEPYTLVPMLQKINIAAVLVGTIGGLGSAFALLISSAIRGYNRISIFIAYFCVVAVAIYVDYCFKTVKSIYRKAFIFIGFIVLCAFSIYDQIPISVRHADRSYIYEESSSDEQFVSEIEKIMPDGAMIYQLPNHLTPEMGSVNGMEDYDQYKPYLYSHKIKWSFGAVKGRIGAAWNEKISSLSLDEMISALCKYNYSGIYINREAYEPEKYLELEARLTELLNENLIISPSGNLSFVSLEPYKNTIYTSTETETIPFADNPMYIKYGASTIEGQKETGQWIWFDKKGAISICNFSNDVIKDYTFHFTLASGYPEEYQVIVTTTNGQKIYPINSTIEISDQITLFPGDNIISFETNAPRVEAPSDPRSLYLRMYNFDFCIY